MTRPAGRGELVPWPGPDDMSDLADGSLLVAATRPRKGVLVVRAIGEIDLLTGPAWRRLLRAALRQAGAECPSSASNSGPDAARVGAAGKAELPRLVCDLSPVTFIGATGLDVLIDIGESSVEAGVELRLVANDGPVRRLFELLGMSRYLVVEDRLDRAVASDLFAAPAPRRATS